MTADLRIAWAELSGALPGRSDVRSSPVPVRTPHGPVRAGLDAAGVHHLLIPVADAADVHEDRRSQGVVVVAQPLTVDGTPQMFADVVCIDGRVFDIYVSFTEDLLDELANRNDDHGKVPARLLTQWRRLLAGAPDAGLSEDVVVGLIGELDLLRRAHAVTGPSVIDSWHGPLGGEHDFTASDVAVEVKTTRSKDTRRVRINGLGQLQEWDDVPLHVWFVRVRRDPNGSTLYEHVAAALDLFGPARVLDLLTHVGYRHTAPEPDEDRWAVLETAMYRVDERFPRLVTTDLRGELRAGVEDVSYVCDLALATSPLDDDAMADVLRGLAT